MLALVALATQSFVLAPGDGLSVSRWTSPADELSSDGLGRGLAFAIDPSLCEVLLPHVAETRHGYWSVGCADVQNVIQRAFATWAVNNPFISFYDVAPLCARLAAGGPECAVAEVYLQARPPDPADPERPMMHVELSTAASVPRTTAPGATPRPGLPSEQLTITKATISILAQPGVEWYLDASICRGMMASGYDVISFMYFVTIVCLVVGSILALLLIHRSLRDDHFCSVKYGPDWKRYKEKVPHIFFPGIF